ncbi:MAG TPA: hypothetical protein VG406_07110 [Isosphaeraceae bacterium]|jgi:hypothetical protein|nr:hypothetical protein [Isosphaeraceae bacterium]
MTRNEWGFSPTPDQLAAVMAAARLYRDRWASIRPPFPAAFDGSLADVRALDYLGYESIDVPGGGIEPAAMVCGEVLRRAADLEWVISYRGDWFVASGDEALRAIAICPLARLHEIECGGRPGAGMYTWFIQKAAFDCLLLLEGEEERGARELLEDGGDYLESVERTLERLRRPSPPSRPKKRHR